MVKARKIGMFALIMGLLDIVEDCFFDTPGITSLATHATSTYYSFFG